MPISGRRRIASGSATPGRGRHDLRSTGLPYLWIVTIIRLADARRRATAAVIGAAGFIGRPLCDALEAEGVRVARYSRSRPFVRDGRLSAELVAARTVFYVATSINPAKAASQADLAAADQRTFVSLLDGLREAGRRPTLIFTSSGGTVYDPQVAPPYLESSPTGPAAAYGRCKLRLECELLARADAVRPVILRLANIYGPGQPESGGVVARWVASAARGDALEIFGSPRAARDYLYIDDTVDALMRAYHLATAGGPLDPAESVFNVGSGTPVMLARLADLVAAAAGRRVQVHHRPGRDFDRLAYWLDVAAAHRKLGWRPHTPLELGVRRTWQALTVAAEQAA
jgi:UDP-glucose 4-epimerase